VYEERWNSEWRRLGLALTGGSAVAAFGWYQATQTFLVLSAKGRLVHPSFWNPILIVLGGLFLVGTYVYFGTHRQRLPMLGRTEAKERDQRLEDEAIHYSIVSEIFPERERLGQAGQALVRYKVKANVRFTNGMRQVIAITVSSLSFQLEGGNAFRVPEILRETLVPGKTQTLAMSPIECVGPDGADLVGWVEFRLTYGLPSAPMNRCFTLHKKIKFVLSDDNPYIDDEINEDEKSTVSEAA
jgi:hypothetical protein